MIDLNKLIKDANERYKVHGDREMLRDDIKIAFATYNSSLSESDKAKLFDKMFNKMVDYLAPEGKLDYDMEEASIYFDYDNVHYSWEDNLRIFFGENIFDIYNEVWGED